MRHIILLNIGLGLVLLTVFTIDARTTTKLRHHRAGRKPFACHC